MAYKYREDLVGKRFLSVSGVTKINVNKVSEWGWKAGVIRAASLKDNKNKELQVMFGYAIILLVSITLQSQSTICLKTEIYLDSMVSGWPSLLTSIEFYTYNNDRTYRAFLVSFTVHSVEVLASVCWLLSIIIFTWANFKINFADVGRYLGI